MRTRRRYQSSRPRTFATRRLPRSWAALALARSLSVVGVHDARHQFVAHDVIDRERHMADAFDIAEQPHGLGKTRGLAAWQIGLARIAGHDHAAVLAKAREKHLHLHRSRILRLVENDDGVCQRSSAHESE